MMGWSYLLMVQVINESVMRIWISKTDRIRTFITSSTSLDPDPTSYFSVIKLLNFCMITCFRNSFAFEPVIDEDDFCIMKKIGFKNLS
jgi:hypothetical protein